MAKEGKSATEARLFMLSVQKKLRVSVPPWQINFGAFALKKDN
jgi:hypothetical protein